MAPLMESLGFVDNLEKAMVVIAIGAGSAVVSHANDSFFWVVTQMSGMDTRMGYRMQTLGTFVLGTTAALTLFVAHLIEKFLPEIRARSLAGMNTSFAMRR